MVYFDDQWYRRETIDGKNPPRATFHERRTIWAVLVCIIQRVVNQRKGIKHDYDEPKKGYLRWVSVPPMLKD